MADHGNAIKSRAMRVHLYTSARRAELSALASIAIVLIAGVIAKSGIAVQLLHFLH